MQNRNLIGMVDYINRDIDISNITLGQEYFYNSVVFCIIDAIYSINAKYISTQNVVTRYCKKNDLDMFRENDSLPNSIENE